MNVSRVRNYALATLSMFGGSLVVFSGVIMINQFNDTPEARTHTALSDIQVHKRPEPKPKKIVKKPPPKKKPQPRSTPPDPLQGLDSAVGNIDVGIPGFELKQLSAADSDLLGDNKEVVMTSDTVDEAPRPVQRTAITYPVESRAKGIEGYVLLSILVDERGAVKRVKVLDAKPDGTFEQAAREGVRQWQFEPGVYQGKKVKAWVRQRIRFDLSHNDSGRAQRWG